MRAFGFARACAEKGSVAIEYALILPVLLVLVIGLIEASRLIWTQTTLDRAVEAAARCAAVDTVQCGNPVSVQDYAVTQAYGIAVVSSAFTVANQTCGVNVSVAYPFTLLIPWTARGELTLRARACYPI